MQKTNQIKALIVLLGGLSFMCFSAVLIKSANAPGVVTAFYRMFIGAVALCCPFLFLIIKNRPKLPRKGIILAILAGICFSFDMALWSTGVVASNATIPTVFANTAPIWVGIGSVLLFREKHKRGFWIGLLLAVSGIPIIVKNDLFISNGIIKGALLGLGAGVFYGIYYLIAQTGRKLIDTLYFLAISTISSAIILGIIVVLTGYSLTDYDPFTYKIFLALGLGVQVIGWFLINYAQGFIPASIVAPTLLGQPVLTAILATFILKEQLTFWQLFGGFIVIAGIYVVHFSRKK